MGQAPQAVCWERQPRQPADASRRSRPGLGEGSLLTHLVRSLALLVLLSCFEAVSFWRDSSRSSSKAYFAARSTGTSRCSPLTGLTRTSCFVELPYQRMLILRISRFRPGCPTCSRSPRESSPTTARISRRDRTPAGSVVLRFLGAPRPVSGGRRSFRYRVPVEAERIVERELARSSEEDYE